MKGSSSSSSSSSSTSSISRWNPTREQVMVLEGLYVEGMRTPNAEEIQEITRRLRVFGAAEGKNVFYWFQNHKARIRQKRKQEERFAFLTQLRMRHQPIMPIMPMMIPSSSSSATFYSLQGQTTGSFGPYVAHQQQVGINYSGPAPNINPNASSYFPHPVLRMVPKQLEEFAANDESASPETLQLFPLQPNSNREEKEEEEEEILSGRSLTCAAFDQEDGEGSTYHQDGNDNVNVVPFFNFFGPSQGNN